jgi:PAS domain S-box-containing protein
MSGRIAAYPWHETALGPRAEWPTTLRLMVDTALASDFPMLVWWGRDLIQLYNDAYITLLGVRHPKSLGQKGSDCWHEVWDAVGPILSGVMTEGRPTSGTDMLFMLERNGRLEERYFTFSYSRIGSADEEGGVLCVNTETTTSVIREREFRSMADTVANILYMQNTDGSTAWVNSRWYEYSRLSGPSAVEPEGWAKVIHPDDLKLFVATVSRAVSGGEPYGVELRIKPDGEQHDAYRWFLVRAVPMRRSDGSVERYAGSATDIHDRRTAEDARRAGLQADLDREHRTSLAFQNAALPQALPTIPGLNFDAIYEAAGDEGLVGGDWYDAFILSDGRLVISVGDVIGSGLTAAVTMSAARQAIRGAAQLYPEPAAILDAADRALRSEQPDRIVTAFLGILDPLTRAFSYASAGHPPPFLRAADGTVIELAASDLPLGLRMHNGAEANVTIMLPEDSLLLLYTDGLTEATRDVIAGERRVREILGSDAVYRSATPASAIRRALDCDIADDVAILALRVERSPSDITRWSFRADDAATATEIRHDIARCLRDAGATANDADDAELVFGELLGNVVRHAAGHAEAALDLSAPHPVLHVLDRGSGFRFYPRLPQDALSESGRGLYITRAIARDVTVVPRPEGGSHARVVLNASVRRP